MFEVKKEVIEFKCGNRTFQYVVEPVGKKSAYHYLIDDHGHILSKGLYGYEPWNGGEHISGDWIHYSSSCITVFKEALNDHSEQRITYDTCDITCRVYGSDKQNCIETVTTPDGRMVRETAMAKYGWLYKKDGIEKLYDAAGNIQSKINYSYDEKHGEAIFYNPDGTVKERRQYENGVWLNADLMTECRDLLANGETHNLLARLDSIIPLRRKSAAGGAGLPFSRRNVLHRADAAILDDRHIAVGIIYDSNFWAPETMCGGGIEWVWTAYGAIVDVLDKKVVQSVEFPSVTVRDRYNPKNDIHIDTKKFFKVNGNSVTLNFYGAPRVMTVPNKTNTATLTPDDIIANAAQNQK